MFAGYEGTDLDISSTSGLSFNAVRSVMLCRRHPLFDTLEVDLDGVDSAARDRRRFGARHVVELCRLQDERRRPVDFTSSVVVSFLR